MLIQTDNGTIEVQYERGESRCQCCGRFIRNIVKIDSVDFGIKCCESMLPRSEFRKASKDFNMAIIDAKNAELKAYRAALIKYIEDAGFKHFFNMPAEALEFNKQQFAARRPALALFALEELRRTPAYITS